MKGFMKKHPALEDTCDTVLSLLSGSFALLAVGFVCKYNGGHCAIDDDMREILERMLDSDLLLFSYPLYCYGMPAMLKNLIDRTLPLSDVPPCDR